MTTIIKVLVTLAILNAVVRVGFAAAGYYQVKDASLEVLTFGAQSSPDELRQSIYRRAQSLQVPLGAEDIVVTRDGGHTTATAGYTQAIELFPGFSYPFTFSYSVDAQAMGGLGPPLPAGAVRR